MFRMTQFMKTLAEDTPIGPSRKPPGPVVIWNLVRRCNLTCKHCYSISADKDFPGELDTDQVFTVMDDLKQFKVPVLILSGGEPLLRPDIYDISHRAKEMGFYVGLSTNGTLITEDNIKQIAEVGYDYVALVSMVWKKPMTTSAVKKVRLKNLCTASTCANKMALKWECALPSRRILRQSCRIFWI